ncbi:Alpha/beta hydrolase family protein [Nocardioides scoriae]|uniref:Alpha/beta hydrolase family protein n=1 Tax=Nocardioides scoriae TaxID=642780 RepID=A0A1H1VI69_9ACTN|nr:alpha/beta fold hydrolase [Nocardioides scoriae]SDS84597.1 Alpha/beta hydrolase family protein [Nocardioides scoriae]
MPITHPMDLPSIRFGRVRVPRPLADADLPDADAASIPNLCLASREFLTGLELVRTITSRSELEVMPDGDGHPVVVLPGFLAGPLSTVVLRSFLRSHGYRTYDWGHGRNLGVREEMRLSLERRLEAICDQHGRRTSLVGWSAGGIFARELARGRPDLVRSVITMGTPIRGNMRATAAWPSYSLLNRGRHTPDMSPESVRLRSSPLVVPTTCIYSKWDGIVAWQLCTSTPAPRTENIQVHCRHLGFGHDVETLRVIADRLAQPEGQWEPYPTSLTPRQADRPVA